jgi:hypothetical protein
MDEFCSGDPRESVWILLRQAMPAVDRSSGNERVALITNKATHFVYADLVDDRHSLPKDIVEMLPRPFQGAPQAIVPTNRHFL